VVGRPQQRRRLLQSAAEEVGVRRFAEGSAELAAEVGAREARGCGHVLDVELLEIARIGKVLGSQQMACRGYEGHRL
jgi:hypothetical protein